MLADDILSIINEEDVNIPTSNIGILEVPANTLVDELPQSHFAKLVGKKGYAPIIRALTNLEVWNKNKNPKLSKWASDMADKLRKQFRPEDESIEGQVLRLIKESTDYVYEITGQTEQEVTDAIKVDIEAYLLDSFIDESEFALEDIKLYGSVTKGKYHEGSDLDVVVLYTGDMRDDGAFDMLQEVDCYLEDREGNQIKVDINPINKDEYSTIQDYLDYCDTLDPATK